MKVVVTDLEGTLTTGVSWRGFRSYVKKYYSAWAYNLFFLTRIPIFLLIKLGLADEQTAKDNWIRDQLRLIKGISKADVEQMAEWIVENEMWPGHRPDVLAEMKEHKDNGTRVIIASGAYQAVVEAFARRLGAEAIGTPLAYEDGRLIGLGAPVSVQARKAQNVKAHVGKAEIVSAYGDTASDVPMMELGELSVAVYPDDELLGIAQERGWRIMKRS